jgi:hypothetical protein
MRNWRVQATGGEVLRAAVCYLDNAGLQLDATLHDSVVVECDAERVEQTAATARRLMVEASEAVLHEPLRVDATLVRPGERWLEDGPRQTWGQMTELLRRVEAHESRSLEQRPMALFAGSGG